MIIINTSDKPSMTKAQANSNKFVINCKPFAPSGNKETKKANYIYSVPASPSFEDRVVEDQRKAAVSKARACQTCT